MTINAAFPAHLDGAAADTLMWLSEADLEPAAAEQIRNVSRLPWVHGVRVMPDAHLGKGATIGTVLAMRDAVSPSTVGVDIGCGMEAARTSLTVDDLPDSLRALRRALESAIPVGFKAHRDLVDLRRLGQDRGFDEFWQRFADLHPSVQSRESKALAQLGTLGGGNHFVELCADESGRIWLTLHSGSRNIGKELAERHIEIAKGLAHNEALPDRDLAVFLDGTPQMAAYLRDLHWAQEYAARSRGVMLALFKQVLVQQFAGHRVHFDQEISCHHNYVAHERYDDVDLIVTRKGAIRAGKGDLGLIPGSMGTGSYVVRGLGNPASYTSASHGAGRRMSRNVAKRRFDTSDLATQTAGVECRKDAGVLDEIPAAYKDIDEVIAAQTDLIEPVERLTTLVCVKG
ncbi:RtcB family protein [Blastococcus sp. Marseille-P5729]|uniref:RtcB family protein n=1 Tax=Blastococcus sp. Marseille-P5729 TaxID=2086582 RepID=UPI000D0FD3E1|nr:RtcB family protein [Blastococcus sp. Marseille-P5729]